MPISLGRFPARRMRRARHDDFTRRLVRQARLSADDLIRRVMQHVRAPDKPLQAHAKVSAPQP